MTGVGDDLETGLGDPFSDGTRAIEPGGVRRAGH